MNRESRGNSPVKHPVKSEALPLSEEAAMQEAAELKAQITLDYKRFAEEYARFAEKHPQGEPTAADYACALDAIQEIKRLAEEETRGQKVLFQTARVFHNLLRAGVGVPVIVVDSLMFTFMTNFESKEFTKNREARGQDWGEITMGLLDADKVIKQWLTDAEKNLKNLERQAKKEVKKDIKSNLH